MYYCGYSLKAQYLAELNIKIELSMLVPLFSLIFTEGSLTILLNMEVLLKHYISEKWPKRLSADFHKLYNCVTTTQIKKKNMTSTRKAHAWSLAVTTHPSSRSHDLGF